MLGLPMPRFLAINGSPDRCTHRLTEPKPRAYFLVRVRSCHIDKKSVSRNETRVQCNTLIDRRVGLRLGWPINMSMLDACFVLRFFFLSRRDANLGGVFYEKNWCWKRAMESNALVSNTSTLFLLSNDGLEHEYRGHIRHERIRFHRTSSRPKIEAGKGKSVR